MDEQFKTIYSRLLSVSGFAEFAQSYNPEPSSEKPIIATLSKFREYRNNTHPLCQEEIYLLDFLQQQLFEYCYSHNSKLLYFIDDTKTIGDEILNEFRTDWEANKTNRYAFKDKEIQTYKTITETFKMEEHSDNGLIYKYTDAYHPLIYSTIGRALNNGGYYLDGVPFIIKGLRYALNPTKPFWHSPYGVFGCVECLWEFIRLLSIDTLKNKYDNSYKPLMELLFLYLSRAIALCEVKRMPQGRDFYRNRGDLLRNHYSIYMAIFMDCGFFATNMDIQFISDNYLGYLLCSALGEPGLGADLLNDSRKMYQYDSLNYLNEDNGYKEIEDASWLELVERGRIRADKVAEYLLGKYDEITLKIEPSLNLMVADILKLHQNNPTRHDWHTNNE